MGQTLAFHAIPIHVLGNRLTIINVRGWAVFKLQLMW
jgi:hypothetical protein